MAETTSEPRDAGDGSDAEAFTPARGRDAWPKRRMHATRGRTIGNGIVSFLTDFGLVPHTYVMTTRGRKTGALRRNPVTLVDDGTRKWLVAPYGPVAWVHNVRAEPRITVRRGGTVTAYTVREIPPAQAGAVLKQYLAIANAVRPYFEATTDSPVEEFTAEAGRHPVFALTPVDPSAS